MLGTAEGLRLATPDGSPCISKGLFRPTLSCGLGSELLPQMDMEMKEQRLSLPEGQPYLPGTSLWEIRSKGQTRQKREKRHKNPVRSASSEKTYSTAHSHQRSGSPEHAIASSPPEQSITSTRDFPEMPSSCCHIHQAVITTINIDTIPPSRISRAPGRFPEHLLWEIS